MSAVAAPSFVVATPVLEHPWLLAARVSHAPRQQTTVRVVPSPCGVTALRQQGKACVVAMLAAQHPHLPTAPEAWRIVDDLDDASLDASDDRNEPRVRRIAVAGPGQLDVDLVVPYDLRVFAGHFQALPLLPGVVQIAWALELAQRHLAGVGRFRGITAVKFRRPVRPGMPLQLALRWTAAACELTFEYRHGAMIASIGRIRMSGNDA